MKEIQNLITKINNEIEAIEKLFAVYLIVNKQTNNKGENHESKKVKKDCFQQMVEETEDQPLPYSTTISR